MRRGFIVLVWLFAAPVASQQLTDAQIQAAIDRGLRKEAPSVRVSGSMTGWYNIHIGGPLSHISTAAERAAASYLPYTLADVTEDDRAPLLYVVASCKPPEWNRYSGMHVNPDAKHVVVQAKKNSQAIQPAHVEPIPMEWKNAVGGVFTCSGLSATFQLSDLPQGQFEIVVVNVFGREQRATVKPEHRTRAGIQ